MTVQKDRRTKVTRRRNQVSTSISVIVLIRQGMTASTNGLQTQAVLAPAQTRMKMRLEAKTMSLATTMQGRRETASLDLTRRMVTKPASPISINSGVMKHPNLFDETT